MKRFSLFAAALVSGFFLAAYSNEDASAKGKAVPGAHEASATIAPGSTTPAPTSTSTPGNPCKAADKDLYGYYSIAVLGDWKAGNSPLIRGVQIGATTAAKLGGGASEPMSQIP
jgi:hypothetical protein